MVKIKKFYLLIILSFLYLPLFIASIMAFNQRFEKRNVSFLEWNKFSLDGFKEITSNSFLNDLLNSLVLGLIVSFIVVIFSLLTCFGIWKQKNKIYSRFLNLANNISLINPDIITALSLTIIFSYFYFSSFNLLKAIIGQTITILPFAIMFMYPRSQKFQQNLLNASFDMGYGVIRSWINVYLPYMSPTIISTYFISLGLSFDDFIIVRVLSNIDTIGTRLYSENIIKNWILLFSAFSLISLTIFLIVWNLKTSKKINEKKGNK